MCKVRETLVSKLVTAKVVVNIVVELTISFQEEQIESYDGAGFAIENITLIGAEELDEAAQNVLAWRAQDIALTQLDLMEIE